MIIEYMGRSNVCWTKAYSSRMVNISVESISLNALYVHVYIVN